MGKTAANVANLFREYVRLDRKRKGDGLSLRELQRWGELKGRLNRTFSPGVPDERLELRESVTVPIRLKVSFESEGELQGSLLTNLSRGGVFVNTALPPAIGTQILLRIRLRKDGSELEVPGEVVSNNVGPSFQTHELGMGIRFLDPSPEVTRVLERLYEGALDPDSER